MKTVSAITASLLDTIEAQIERKIIDNVISSSETNKLEFREYAAMGVLEIIALRKVIHELKIKLLSN